MSPTSDATLAVLILAGLGGWLLVLAGLVVVRQAALALAAAIDRADAFERPVGLVAPEPPSVHVEVVGGLEELALELLAQASIRGRRPA